MFTFIAGIAVGIWGKQLLAWLWAKADAFLKVSGF